MLIVLVTIFLLVEIPMAIATLIHVLSNLGLFEGESHLHYLKLIIILCNFIIMLSFPLNFAIYCGMSAQFRNTFKSLLIDNVPGCHSLLARATDEEATQEEAEPTTQAPANVHRMGPSRNGTPTTAMPMAAMDTNPRNGSKIQNF